MTNIVNDLRLLESGARWVDSAAADVLERGANEIERLLAERDRLRGALWQVLTVMPVFPDAAKQIVGMEDRYNAAITNARAALKETGHE